MGDSYKRRLLPKTIRTKDYMYANTTRIQDNSYPGQLVLKTTCTLLFGNYKTTDDNGILPD